MSLRTVTFLLILCLAATAPICLAQQQPNVLLIISDDLNTRIGPYDRQKDHTPHLDRLASEGVQFDRTYCQYPLCGPSRASFMSGLYPETNKLISNQYIIGNFRTANSDLADHPSLAGFFKEQGYYSARVSKIFHMGVPGGIENGGPGADDPDSWDYAYNVLGPETLSQGTLELLSPKNLHYGGNFSRMIIRDELAATQTDYMATSQAIALLESRAAAVAEGATNKVKPKPQAPFFIGVGLVRPHVPFVAPENCYEPYPDTEMEIPEAVVNDNVPSEALRQRNERGWGMEEHHKEKVISGYLASVRFMDQQVGRLLDALDRLDLRKETIVVFISDHGYNLGEHDCWSKVSLWEGSVRVPMIIADPRYPASHGTTVNGVTELIDLYPTLADLSGLQKNAPKILQGRSLAPAVRGDDAIAGDIPAYTISFGGKGGTLRTGQWRYTRWGEDVAEAKEELYDHTTDPEEHHNLAGDEANRDALVRMRELFERRRALARNGLDN